MVIDNKQIFYKDRKWEKQIRCIPKDEEFIQKIKLSRNKIPDFLVGLFELSKEEQEEYDNAKTEEELAEFCIRDVKKIGGKLIKYDKV